MADRNYQNTAISDDLNIFYKINNSQNCTERNQVQRYCYCNVENKRYPSKDYSLFTPNDFPCHLRKYSDDVKECRPCPKLIPVRAPQQTPKLEPRIPNYTFRDTGSKVSRTRSPPPGPLVKPIRKNPVPNTVLKFEKPTDTDKRCNLPECESKPATKDEQIIMCNFPECKPKPATKDEQIIMCNFPECKPKPTTKDEQIIKCNLPLCKPKPTTKDEQIIKCNLPECKPKPATKNEQTYKCDDLKYVKFLLNITSDIIKNNLCQLKEYEIIFKDHVDANKNRLNEKKMWAEIEKLKREILGESPTPKVPDNKIYKNEYSVQCDCDDDDLDELPWYEDVGNSKNPEKVKKEDEPKKRSGKPESLGESNEYDEECVCFDDVDVLPGFEALGVTKTMSVTNYSENVEKGNLVRREKVRTISKTTEKRRLKPENSEETNDDDNDEPVSKNLEKVEMGKLVKRETKPELAFGKIAFKLTADGNQADEPYILIDGPLLLPKSLVEERITPTVLQSSYPISFH